MVLADQSSFHFAQGVKQPEVMQSQMPLYTNPNAHEAMPLPSSPLNNYANLPNHQGGGWYPNNSANQHPWPAVHQDNIYSPPHMHMGIPNPSPRNSHAIVMGPMPVGDGPGQLPAGQALDMKPHTAVESSEF